MMVLRRDGRTAQQLRQMSCVQSVLIKADGSCRLNQGNTCVLAAVYGPKKVQVSKEQVDRATIQVTLKAKSGGVGAVSYAEEERSLRQTFEGVVMTSVHPRTLIHIIIQVVHDDGSLLSACFNAATMALADASVPMGTLLTSVRCSISRGGVLALDTTSAEEEECQCTVTTAMLRATRHNADNTLAFVHTRGPLSAHEYSEAMSLGQAAAASVAEFSDAAMRRRLGVGGG